MRSYFSVYFSNTQVRALISRPLGKRCSKASFSVLSQIYVKMWKAIFTKFFFILETKRLFHDLFLKRCSKACICGNKSNQFKNIRSCFYLAILITLSQIYVKMLKAIFTKFFLILETKQLFHNFLRKTIKIHSQRNQINAVQMNLHDEKVSDAIGHQGFCAYYLYFGLLQ